MRAWITGLLLGMLPVCLLPALPPPLAMAALGMVGLAALIGRSGRWRCCSGVLLGAVWAMLQGQALLAARLADDCAGQPLAATGRVASLPRLTAMPDGELRQRFEFAIESLAPSGCSGPRRILLSYYGDQAVEPGQWWRLEVRLRKPWGLANPGSFNMQAWFAESGIDAVGSVRGTGATRLARPPGLSSLPDRLRLQVRERLANQGLPADAAAILAAVTVADKSGIDARLWSLFQTWGINHLLVISGLHIGLVGGGAFLLGRLLQRVCLLSGLYLRGLPALSALLCAGAYAALAGFSIATQRALCMLACFLVANLLGRSSRSDNNLLLAAVAVLVLNPLALLGSGLWLSFGAVAALLWLARWQQGRSRWRRLLAVHGFMSLVMLPLGGWWFGGGSLVAAVANLLMIPLVGMYVVPLALLGVLAMYALPGLEHYLWSLAAWPLDELLPIARRLAGEGGGWIYRPLAPTLPALLLAIAGVMLLVVPLSMRVRLLAALLLLPLLLPREPPSPDNPADTRVTVLDVGQGTAVVVQAGAQALVYDTGGGDPAGANMATSVVLPFLRHRGIRVLDTLVISHADNDHSAGLEALLAAMPVRQLVRGGEGEISPGRPCVAGRGWQWPGGQRFRFLSPALETGSGLGSNDGSCVLQIQVGAQRLLLAGDIEAPRERQLVRYWGNELASDWLLVAHHGSNTSTTHALLKHVRPSGAIISRGFGNRFGHPHPLVLQRLKQLGVAVWDTADAGAIELHLSPGERPAVRRYRDGVRRFWM